jgi:hypothetical protein
MISGISPGRRGEYDVDHLIGAAKVDDSTSVEEAVRLLTPREKFAILNDRTLLQALLAKPFRARPPETR